jgi:hypothetical protein
MHGAEEPIAVAGAGPEVIAPLVEAVRRQAMRLSNGDPNEPLAYAWLSCLESTMRVGRVLEAQRGPRRSGMDTTAAEELQEALSASRGAAAAVRFLLYGLDESARQPEGRLQEPEAEAA